MLTLIRIGAFSLTLLVVDVVHGQSTERIVIDGSTGVMPLAAALAKAFQERQPSVAIDLGSGLGTKARISALATGKIDIALASHGLDVGEITRAGMVVYEIARVPVVFGVNATVSVTDLSDQQVCDLYLGRATSWKAFGGQELAIAPRTRPDSEVDAEVARASIGCLRELKMPDAVKVMAKGGDMAKELAATAGAIGMTTMTVVEQSQGKIRAISLNGVAPTPGDVERKTYRMVRQSFFVVKNPPSPAVAKFIEFARGPQGWQVIGANGAIPVK